MRDAQQLQFSRAGIRWQHKKQTLQNMLYGIKLYSIARTSHCFLTCSATSDMLPSTLLIFDLDGTRFGLDATLVRESVWLPELTPVEEAPPHIAGIFSLRGQIVPVTDLHLRFGHPARPYCISDQIVVLELDQLLIGLIVSEVREVIEVSLDAIKPPPKFDGEAHAHLVEGEVRVGDDIVTLLDVR
ncbi:MAG: purine-binding chemotaxis protein CheW, partial [Gallionella sp.]